MTWREVYQAPFYSDEYGIYMWSKNGTITFTFNSEKQNMINSIVNKLNGDSSIKFDSKFTLRNNIYFHYDGEFAFYIRGWGKLTGVGGYHLPADKAAKIQDEFAKWVLETLNN
jgi:hypothetical protein